MLENIVQEIKQEKVSMFQNSFNNIFSWKELENLINLRPLVSASRFRTVKNDPQSWDNQSWLTDVNTYPPTLVNKLINDNLCFFIDCSRVNKTINSICGELENIFEGGSSDAHIYFTCAEVSDDGFGIHWDHSHNLIVQVEGQTHFRGWNIQNKTNRFVKSLSQHPNIDMVLNPGDAVFVPRYFYHEAISKNKRMGISFPISFDDQTKAQDRFWIELT